MRVLLADDHLLVAEGIKRALDDTDDFEVVGAVSNGAQVMPLVRRTSPDLVLLDLRMPGMDGLTALENIKRENSDIKVVIVSASDDPALIEAALSRGASAFILKSVDPRDLPGTLRQAVNGTVFSSLVGAAKNGDSPAANLGLTSREITILKALAQGLSNGAIARQEFVAEQTVKFHLTNIYRKLNATNRTEAVRLAYQHGIVSNPIYED